MIGHIKEYANVRIQLYKLEATERNARLGSEIVAAVIIGITGAFTLMMLSIAAALYLGFIWGAWYWGFLAIGGLYFLLLMIIILNRNRWIKEPVSNSIIDTYFKTENATENESNASSDSGKAAA